MIGRGWVVGAGLLLAAACRASPGASQADAAGETPAVDAGAVPVDSAVHDRALPAEPRPISTACQWQPGGPCVGAPLCARLAPGLLDCQGAPPHALPGFDEAGQPRLLVVGVTSRPADLGQLARFEGNRAVLEERKVPDGSPDQWKARRLVFLEGATPALVDLASAITLRRLGTDAVSETLVDAPGGKLTLHDTLAVGPGTFWILFGREDASSSSIRTLLLARYTRGRLEPPVEVLPAGSIQRARLSPGPSATPLVTALVFDGATGTGGWHSWLVTWPDPAGRRLMLPTQVYAEAALTLGDAVVLLTSPSWSQPDRRVLQIVGADGTLGAPFSLGPQPEVRRAACVPTRDPAGNPRDPCGGGAATSCREVGTERDSVSLLTLGDRALVVTVLVQVDRDRLSGTRQEFRGDMPPTCQHWEREGDNRSAVSLVVTELTRGAAGPDIVNEAVLPLAGWHRPAQPRFEVSGQSAIVTLTQTDGPQVATLLVGP